MTISPVHTSPYASTGDGTIHTCPIFPTPTAGRLLTAIISTLSTSPTVTAGWSQIAASITGGSTGTIQYWRWSDGTETGLTVDVTASGAQPCCVEVTEWSGLTNVGPDVATATFTSGTTTSPTSGTTAALAASGELVLAAFAYSRILPNTPPTFTPPAGYTTLDHRRTSNTVGRMIDLAVCYQIAGTAGAQTATGSYTLPEDSVSGNIVAYLKASTLAPGQIYPYAKQSWLTQSPSIDVDSDTIKAAIGRVADGFTFDPTHQYFSSVESVMATNYAASVTVPGITGTVGLIGTATAHIQFPVSSGAELDFLIMFDDKGSAATSPLVAYLPLASPVLPVAGKVVQIDWDQGSRTLAGILRI